MFDREQLTRAVGLSELGHAFMKWLGERDRDITLAFDRTHDASLAVPDATRAWVEHNYAEIPEHCRPARDDLGSFGNLVGTYLETSFDLVPGRKGLVSATGCFCSVCTSFRELSSLTPKRLGRHDKADAVVLMRCYLRDRAAEIGCAVDDAAMVDDPLLGQPIAMATWGRELLRRLEGETAGPAVLALWRMFAWLPTGSPRPGFRITADEILRADRAIAAAISSGSW